MKSKLSDTLIKKHLSTNFLLFIRDSQLTGFGVRITPKGTASFIIETTNKAHKIRRKTIGRFPILTTDQARELATNALRSLKHNISNQIDLDTAFNHYINNVRLKNSTREDYITVFKGYLADWKNLGIEDITQEMVLEKYLSTVDKTVSQSNKSMKIVQAVLRYSGVSNNPVQILSRKRLLRQLKPRTSYIPLQDLSLFYKGLSELKHSHVRRYLELLIHTGLRAGEAMQITNSSVTTGVLIITDTKNHSDHHIPLTEWLRDNLIPFLEANPEGFKSSDIRKSLLTASQYLDYRVTRHDLRRTFASYASEAGCDYLLIKRALNHTVSDITARYIQTSPSTLAPVFDAVANLISAHSNNK